VWTNTFDLGLRRALANYKLGPAESPIRNLEATRMFKSGQAGHSGKSFGEVHWEAQNRTDSGPDHSRWVGPSLLTAKMRAEACAKDGCIVHPGQG